VNLIDRIRAVVDRLNPVWVDPPVLQPAGLYLELAGEDLRRRAFLIEPAQEGGGEGDFCLRPDMTVPALRLARTLKPEPAVVAYQGLVFRKQPPGSPRESEFLQVGAEWIDPDQDLAATDAAVISASLECCAAAGVRPLVRLGDWALLDCALAAVGLSPGWQNRLRDLARSPHPVTLDLVKAQTATRAGGLGAVLAGLPRNDAEALVAEVLNAKGHALVGGRSLADITVGLMERHASSQDPLPDEGALARLLEVMALEAPAEGALARIAALAPKHAGLQAACAAAAQRVLPITDRGLELYFSLRLGRGPGYYSGFVLELEAPQLGPRASLGGGGRYDGVGDQLFGAGKKPSRAAGFAVRPQRLAAAQGAGT
jgi:ATP phosphoribosyltransferase regulatory subunit